MHLLRRLFKRKSSLHFTENPTLEPIVRTYANLMLRKDGVGLRVGTESAEYREIEEQCRAIEAEHGPSIREYVAPYMGRSRRYAVGPGWHRWFVAAQFAAE